MVGSGQLPVRTGEGQAALVGLVEVPVLALRQGDDRVADHPDVSLVVVVGAVEDEDGEVDADLVGGQTDALGGLHGGEHVLDQLVQVVVERP